MAKSALLFLVGFGDFLVVLAMASEMSPSPIPSTIKKSSPLNRKLGLHQVAENGAHDVWDPSPSPAPQPAGSGHLTGEDGSDHTSGEPASMELVSNGDALNLQTKEFHLKKQHKSVDKSVAGGAVILGSLAMVFLGAVFCYIRATGKQKQEPTSTAA